MKDQTIEIECVIIRISVERKLSLRNSLISDFGLCFKNPKNTANKSVVMCKQYVLHDQNLQFR